MVKNKKINRGKRTIIRMCVGLGILAIVLFFILIMAILTGDKNNNGFVSKGFDYIENKELENIPTKPEVNDEYVEKLLNRIKIDKNTYNEENYYFLSESVNVNGFSNQLKLSLVFQFLENSKLYNFSDIVVIPRKIVYNAIKILFGSLHYIDEDFYGVCSNAIFDASTYEYHFSTSCVDNLDSYYSYKTLSYEEVQDKLHIYQKAFYTRHGDMNYEGVLRNSLEIYTPNQNESLIRFIDDENIKGYLNADEIFETYDEFLPTYKYTFVLEDNEYKFYSVEKVS